MDRAPRRQPITQALLLNKIGWLVLAGLLFISGIPSIPSSYAQSSKTNTELPSPAASNTKPQAPSKVDVKPIAKDDQISQRLKGILEATQWFEEVQVSVQNGVVFLDGKTKSDEYSRWATELTKNTQDVAAVVNRIVVTERSVWDLSPAIGELDALWKSAIRSSPFVLFAIVVLILTILAASIAKRIAKWGLLVRIPNTLLRQVAIQAIAIPIYLIGFYLVLRVSGLTQLALTVLGGTGLIGLVIGIAFRNIAENFLASILISAQNPFRNGDHIEVNNFRGLVQRVTTRGTVLMTFDGNHVQIPNSIIYQSVITNYTANPRRRALFRIRIGYEDAISDAQDLAVKTASSHPDVLKDPAPTAFVDDLSPSAITLVIYIWLDGSKNSPEAVRSGVMRMVKQAFQDAHISMPDEAREVIFPQGVPVKWIEQASARQPKEVSYSDSRYNLDIFTSDKTNASDNLEANNEKDGNHSSLESKEANHESHKQGRSSATKSGEEQAVTPAEGKDQDNIKEIQEQAKTSWTPEAGTDLLNPNK